MKKIKPLLLSSLLIVPIFSTSCFNLYKEDKEADFSKKNYSFYNVSNEYDIPTQRFSFYYYKNSNVPYVDINETIRKLEGLFDLKNYYKKESWISPKVSYYTGNGSLDVNWKQNKLSFYSSYFSNFTKDTQQTDYSRNIKYSTTFYKDFSPEKIVMDLNKYNFDVYRFNKKTLIPFALFNTLFCSPNYYNLYFNSEKIIGADFGLNDRMKYIENIRKSKIANTEAPKDVREATFNHLSLVMNYFYGLKEYKNVDDFKDVLSLKKYKEKILSTKSSVYNEAYADFFYGYLNELHTSMSMLSFYDKPEAKIKDLGEKIQSAYKKAYNEKYNLLSQKREKLWGNRYLRYIGNNTAVISFDEFLTGTKEEISSSEAYKYDTYQLFKYLMNEIKNNKNIKKIIIDLSLNGGGNTAAMWKALGFLTNKKLLHHSYNNLNDTIHTTGVDVDVNGDGDYEDDDAYTEYDWYVLAGINTFSAANQFVNIVKEMKIAKVIGQKTGGGMCSIVPMVLVDGTSIIISSNSALKHKKNNTFMSTEGGLYPDINLDYNDFYNDDKLSQLVNE